MVLPLIAIGITTAGAYYFAEEEVENMVSEGAKAAIKIAQWSIETIIEAIKEGARAISLSAKIKQFLEDALQKITTPAATAYLTTILLVSGSILIIKSRLSAI